MVVQSGIFLQSLRTFRSGHILRSSIRAAYRNFIQALFTIFSLPFEAFYHFDAIFRTIWRMIIIRQKIIGMEPFGSLKKQIRH